MAVQNRLDILIEQFELAGEPQISDGQVILQDAGRGAADMEVNTLMCKVAASGKWIPFEDETLVNGNELPRGILRETIPAADIVAGDVEDVNITRTGLIFDEALLVIENSKTLDTVITSATCRVRDWLIAMGLSPETTQYADRGENA